MEQHDLLSNDLLSNDLQITPAVENTLMETGKWGKFLAIVGFILAACMAIFAFSIASFLSQYNTYSSSYYAGVKSAITIVYLIFATLLFLPSLLLYKFSVKMQQALKMMDQERFESSFQSLKATFRFWGVIGIIVVIFFILALLGTLVKV